MRQIFDFLICKFRTEKFGSMNSSIELIKNMYGFAKMEEKKLEILKPDIDNLSNSYILKNKIKIIIIL